MSSPVAVAERDRAHSSNRQCRQFPAEMPSYVAAVLSQIGRRRAEKATEALAYAVEASGETLDGFLYQATATDRRMELLTRTLFIAQDTALREKRWALGRALAAGIAGDDAKIDEELPFIKVVADLDTPHIKLLARLADGPPLNRSFPLGYWDGPTVAARMPDMFGSWPALLVALELHGLIGRMESSTPYQGSRTAYVRSAKPPKRAWRMRPTARLGAKLGAIMRRHRAVRVRTEPPDIQHDHVRSHI
jgi:hypothetical protein